MVSPFPKCPGFLGMLSPDPNPWICSPLSFNPCFFLRIGGIGVKTPGKRHGFRSMRNLDLQSFGNFWSRHKPHPGIPSQSREFWPGAFLVWELSLTGGSDTGIQLNNSIFPKDFLSLLHSLAHPCGSAPVGLSQSCPGLSTRRNWGIRGLSYWHTGN